MTPELWIKMGKGVNRINLFGVSNSDPVKALDDLKDTKFGQFKGQPSAFNKSWTRYTSELERLKHIDYFAEIHLQLGKTLEESLFAFDYWDHEEEN